MKDLLINLSHYPFNSSDRDRLSELLSRVDDWEKAVKLINAHGIIALAAYNIQEAGLDALVPEYAMRLLRDGQRQSMIRNVWLTGRWKEVNKILNEAGIKHVLLKGMALEYSVYGGKGLRQMTDNDILVRKEEALKSWYILQDHGFQPEMSKSALHKKIIIELGKHLPALKKEGYTVEIHHRLFKEPDANEPLSDAIDNAVEINAGGDTGYILPQDIHLAFLNEHFLQHMAEGECQLRLYADMELLKPGSSPELPDSFIENPHQPVTPRQRMNTYRNLFFSLPLNHRLRFLAGDLFPSVKWMKKRHGCGTLAAIFFYPRRIAKLFWLR